MGFLPFFVGPAEASFRSAAPISKCRALASQSLPRDYCGALTALITSRDCPSGRFPVCGAVTQSDAQRWNERPSVSRGEEAALSTGDPEQVYADGEVLIELRGVWKSFGENHVLRGANIKIRRGEAVGIIGGSGTGKSTTLRLMAGLMTPDEGEVYIKGKLRRGLLSDDPDVGRLLNIGMVFQNGALFDSLTVGENVGFLLYEHSRLPATRIQELVDSSLAAVGLSGVEDLLPSELSGGMRKRVALARAIMRDTAAASQDQVIMYDEPTAGLDPVASTVVEDLIRSMHMTDMQQRYAGNGDVADSGGIAAYIVVTHQHSTIRRAVDRLIFLHEGVVVWEGSAEEFNMTSEPIVRQFASGSLSGPIKYE